MNGPNKFKVKLDALAIAEITDSAEYDISHTLLTDYVKLGAPVKDITTARILLALEEYLKEHRCEPDFVVVLSE